MKKANGEPYSFFIDERGNSWNTPRDEAVLKRTDVEVALVGRLKRPATEQEVLRECLKQSGLVGHCLDERYLYRLWYLWISEFGDEDSSIVAVLDADEESCDPHIFFCREFAVEPEDFDAALEAREDSMLFFPEEDSWFKDRFVRWMALRGMASSISQKYGLTTHRRNSFDPISIVKNDERSDRAVMRIDLIDLTFEDFRGIKEIIDGQEPKEIQGFLFEPLAAS